MNSLAKAKRMAVTSVLALTLTSGGFALGALPASAVAANAKAWVITPKWWGWCPNAGGLANKVVQVHVINYTTGTDTWGTKGYDKVYIPVTTGYNNQVQISVNCSLSKLQSTGGYHNLSVTANGQTFFTGTDGGVWRQ